jgi:hypothetical protein
MNEKNKNRAVEVVDSGIPLPRISEVTPLSDHQLRVTWSEGVRSGETQVVDLSPVIAAYKIYRALRNDDALFRTAHLTEGGDVVAWKGDDLEMTAELIQELAEQTMTPADFAKFLERNDLTQEAAAMILGRSRRQIGYYLTTGPIPRVVALACYGFEAQKRAHEQGTERAARYA